MSTTKQDTRTAWRAALQARVAPMTSAWRAGPDGEDWAGLPALVLEELRDHQPDRVHAAAKAERARADDTRRSLPDSLRLLKSCRARFCALVGALGLDRDAQRAASEFLLTLFDDLEVALCEAWSTSRHELPPRHVRLEAVAQLAAGLAHEVNTPVQFLANNVEFLGDAVQVLVELSQAQRFGIEDLAETGGERGQEWLDQAARDEEEADVEFLVEELPDALHQCAQGLTHVSEMIHGLKAFGPGGDGKQQSTDLNDLVRITASLLTPSFDSSIELDLDLDPEAPRIFCDPRAMRQIVYDLVDNAGRAIEVALGPQPNRLGHVHVRTRKEKDTLVLEVEDDGDGVPSSFRNHLFDPGFSTWARDGHGLAYVQTVIEGFGGAVKLSDAPGGGAVAQVRIPAEF